MSLVPGSTPMQRRPSHCSPHTCIGTAGCLALPPLPRMAQPAYRPARRAYRHTPRPLRPAAQPSGYPLAAGCRPVPHPPGAVSLNRRRLSNARYPALWVCPLHKRVWRPYARCCPLMSYLTCQPRPCHLGCARAGPGGGPCGLQATAIINHHRHRRHHQSPLLSPPFFSNSR